MRLILHAGTHKTGTKSLQRSLYKNREALKKKGIIYPQPLGEWGDKKHWSHNWVAKALTGVYEEGEWMVREMLDCEAALADEGDVLLLSAEDLSCCCAGHRLWQGLGLEEFRVLQEAYLCRLAEVLEGFEVEVVMVFRRADAYAQSLYQTIIRSDHYRGGFEEFLEYGRPLFEYRNQVGMFVKAFGVVRTLSYHELSDDLVGKFLGSLGYEMPMVQNMRKNVSVDARLTSWARNRNLKSVPTREEIRRQKKFCRSVDVRGMYHDFGRASFWRSLEDRDRFHQMAAVGMEEGLFPAVAMEDSVSADIDGVEYERINEAFENWEGGQS